MIPNQSISAAQGRDKWKKTSCWAGNGYDSHEFFVHLEWYDCRQIGKGILFPPMMLSESECLAMFGVCAPTVISSSEGSLHDLSEVTWSPDVGNQKKNTLLSYHIRSSVWPSSLYLRASRLQTWKASSKTPPCSRPEFPEKNAKFFEVHLERKGQMPQWRSATSWELLESLV